MICDIYEGVLEISHALTIKNGYSIKNHVCITNFFKDFLKKEEISAKFDKYRKIRNNILYYGKIINTEIGKEDIKELTNLFDKIRAML